jgi:F-type H+-transporting ATPase subunit b
MSYLSTVLIASAEGEGGLFDFNATLPLVALQFVVLMFALNVIFYAPIMKILDDRDVYIRNTLKEASDILLKADDMSTKYEQKLVDARKQSQVLISKTEEDTKVLVDKEIALTQKDINDLINTGTRELNIQKDLSLKTLQEQVDTLSEQIKAKLLVGTSV